MKRSMSAVLAAVLTAASVSAAPVAAEEFSDKGFLDAAYKHCAEVDNRAGKSCDCEQKLIKDRVTPEDKVMSFYYWTDKAKFKTEYEARTKADPQWQEQFSERMSNVQALIIAACGA